MTTVPAPSPGADAPAQPASLPADAQRGRLRDFLASQQRRWSLAELQLLEQVEHLIGELSGIREAGGTASDTPSDAAAVRRECAQESTAEVESLKARIAELERQLAQAPSLGRVPMGGHLDWEAEKRRILAALESEAGDDDQAGHAERMKTEQVIRTTDKIVADKQREVAELQGLLASQSSNLASVAVGAAALGKTLDQDGVIRQEREALKQLQEQWREKLCQAEIEISVQRAQIARQKAEVDARCRALAQPAPAQDEPAGADKTDDKPLRGRWLARLGLKLDEH
jgi:chromosome condensin MukBEF ATPase and DNA-binding subunit MukB